MWIRKLRGWKSKTKFRLRRKTTEMIRLTAWEAMVAHAAPATPQPRPITNQRSSAIFTDADTARKASGTAELPTARSSEAK